MSAQKLRIPKEYVKAILVSNCHLASQSATTQFKRYVFGKRKDNGMYVINIEKMWDKLVLAARAFVAIQDPKDIVVSSNKNFGRRAVIKFCEETGATPFTGRFIPGGFTNQFIQGVKEPRLIIVSDSFADKQTIMEASYVNTPCIAFVNSDNSLSRVDIAIPINNRSPNSIGCGFYLLAKVIRYLRNEESFDKDVKTELEGYLFRDSVDLVTMENVSEESNEPTESAVLSSSNVPLATNEGLKGRGWDE